MHVLAYISLHNPKWVRAESAMICREMSAQYFGTKQRVLTYIHHLCLLENPPPRLRDWGSGLCVQGAGFRLLGFRGRNSGLWGLSSGCECIGCNLVCFTLVPGQLTGTTPREIRTLMVHHISLATIADQAQTQPVDRFGDAARRRRLLRGADGAAEKTHQRTRLVLVRSAAAGTAGDQGTKETASEASTTRSVVIGISVAAAVVVFLGVAVWCASEASCTIDGCDSCFHHRRKTKRRRAKIGYY